MPDFVPVDEYAILNAKRCIVIHALTSGVNTKLPTSVEFNQKHGVVAGTMQRALKMLKSSKALITKSKGHMGREITEINTGLCWNLAKLKPVQLVMPNQGAIEINTLIKHIGNKLGALKIPYFISNQPGSKARITQVLSGNFDITLASFGATESVQKKFSTWQLKVLSSNTYYSLNRLVIVSRVGEMPKKWKKVAIDNTSSDHVQITKAEFQCKNNCEYVNTNFTQIPARIIKGEVDAGLWHITSSPIPLSSAGLKINVLQNDKAIDLHRHLSAAAFVANPKRPELAAILKEMDNDRVLELQRQAFLNEDPYNKAFE